jgi:hypothetical protein
MGDPSASGLEHPILEQLMQEGYVRGKRIEITLKQGAEYYNGPAPVPTVTPRGFIDGDSMRNEPGRTYTGYVLDFEARRVRVAFGWDQGKNEPDLRPSEPVFFDYSTIHSFRG